MVSRPPEGNKRQLLGVRRKRKGNTASIYKGKTIRAGHLVNYRRVGQIVILTGVKSGVIITLHTHKKA